MPDSLPLAIIISFVGCKKLTICVTKKKEFASKPIINFRFNTFSPHSQMPSPKKVSQNFFTQTSVTRNVLTAFLVFNFILILFYVQWRGEKLCGGGVRVLVENEKILNPHKYFSSIIYIVSMSACQLCQHNNLSSKCEWRGCKFILHLNENRNISGNVIFLCCARESLFNVELCRL